MMIKKALYSVIFFLMTVSVAHAAESLSAHQDLVGPVSESDLLVLDAFAASYKTAIISEQEVQLLTSIDSAISLRVLFGTWCHDSVREVPKLIKLIELAENPNLSLRLTAISRDKLEPSAVVARYGLEFTPTLVVLKDKKEVGRIIEQPDANWASDIIALIQQH
ncbi:thioredoxin family protein [Simiduia curdlanivorans]|uniref:Thioredoxin family protein n=1 Tax=Simiduia curdlanivorans TaxID=1492769 RepID=A0ABV8V0S4_9GAMM|nr:thioredoxin family protein [Simiduia curdlanivorans]MDN3637713.1 thioredoxin family protein [Simiduia curdlanivorans]